VGVLNPLGKNVFDLRPQAFPGGVTLTGTVTTDGTKGFANLLDWKITKREVTTWKLNKANSVIWNLANVAVDGKKLVVTPFDANSNPGALSFGFGRLDPTVMILADYTLDPTGAAGFVSPLIYQTTSPLPLDAKGQYVLGEAVP
jgi:hypothetical protein